MNLSPLSDIWLFTNCFVSPYHTMFYTYQYDFLSPYVTLQCWRILVCSAVSEKKLDIWLSCMSFYFSNLVKFFSDERVIWVDSIQEMDSDFCHVLLVFMILLSRIKTTCATNCLHIFCKNTSCMENNQYGIWWTA